VWPLGGSWHSLALPLVSGFPFVHRLLPLCLSCVPPLYAGDVCLYFDCQFVKWWNLYVVSVCCWKPDGWNIYDVI
jgi:hypothetical protein